MKIYFKLTISVQRRYKFMFIHTQVQTILPHIQNKPFVVKNTKLRTALLTWQTKEVQRAEGKAPCDVIRLRHYSTWAVLTFTFTSLLPASYHLTRPEYYNIQHIIVFNVWLFTGPGWSRILVEYFRELFVAEK